MSKREKEGTELWNSPSEDRTDRFPVDRLIRDHGWRILQRKRGKEAVWIKGGKKRKQSKLLSELPQVDVVHGQEIDMSQFEE